MQNNAQKVFAHILPKCYIGKILADDFHKYIKARSE